MIKLIKTGGKLEKREMKSIYGSGDCGTTDCTNCGTIHNDYKFYKIYFQSFAS
jgi:hypothetical protein